MPSSRPVARLTTPAELVASLPYSVGFVPTESLVVLCCHEPRGRTGLCMRFDLPSPDDRRDLVAEVVERVRHERATRVVLAVYTAEPGTLPQAGLVAAVDAALDGVRLTEAVLVRDGRFWSYLCSEPGCCPVEGTPVGAGENAPSVQLLQAESVLRGRAVLPDRASLVAALATPVGAAADAARRRCARCEDLLTAGLRKEGVGATRRASLTAWRAALDRFASPPATLGDLEASALAVSLCDVAVRDEVAALTQRYPDALPLLLTEVCRRTPPPYDAPACAVLAWVTYAAGGGALVTVALERALAADPTYSLARLLAEAIARQVPPEVLRRALKAVPVSGRSA